MRPFGVTPFSRQRRTPTGVIRARGAAGLARWLARAHPAALKKALAANPQLLGDLGQAAPTLADKATQLAQAVLPFLQLDVQRRLLRTQVKRAEQGLPPLDTSQIDLPAARVEVDVEAGQGTRKGLVGLAGAVILGALLLFSGRRRRS